SLLCPDDDLLQPLNLLCFRLAGNWARVHNSGVSRTTIQTPIGLSRGFLRGRRHRFVRDGCCLGRRRRWLCRNRSRRRCGSRWRVSMTAVARLDDYIDAFFILLDDRERATSGLKQRGQFSFHKSLLFIRIAHMTERRSHVNRPAHLTLEQDIVTAQMDLGGLARGLKLLQVSVAEFVLFVSLVADGLIDYSLRDCGPNVKSGHGFSFPKVRCHLFL